MEKDRPETTKHGALIIAAGLSSRMDGFKPLLSLGDTTVLGVVLATAEEAGLSPLVVVTGYRHKDIEEWVEKTPRWKAVQREGRLLLVQNSRYEEGMFTSIREGIKALRFREDSVKGAFLLPVDVPLAGAKTIKAMEERMSGNAFAVPTFMGKKGHPLYVPAGYFREILDHDGTGGLKGITDAHPEAMEKIPGEEEGILLDMDTREQYEEVKRHLAEGPGPSLLELAKGRCIYLVRHGQIQQHEKKIFLGRTDVPLNDLGKEQARRAGEALRRELKGDYALFCSPCTRAKETAALLGLGPAAEMEDFTEMALGEWDGRFIEDIQKEFPEAYERRGKDLFGFKIGNNSENFYDVAYRATKGLRKVLSEREEKTIVIVTHRGVLRSLENALKGKGVEEDWPVMETGTYRCFEL